MTSASPEVDPRVVRWMSRRGQGLRLSAAAALLLAPRLRVRWWAGLAAIVVMVSVSVWWFPAQSHLLERGGTPSPSTALRFALPYLVGGVLLALFVATTRWRDRRIAAELPRRVTRVGAVGVRTVLGTPTCLAVGAAAAVHVAILALVVRSEPGIVAISFATGLLAIGVVVGVALAVVVRRPTVALDDSSLWVDERLRSRDAVLALTPWWWADVALNGVLLSGRAPVASAVIGLSLLPVVAYAAASLRSPRWQR